MEENMEYSDSVKLLKECEAGTKMGIAAIDEVQEKIKESDLKKVLQESREHHEKIENEIHDSLLKNGAQDKEPNPMAKSMSWMKTNMKLAVDESDHTIADLITDGCDMGIKSLNRYRNQYKNADVVSRELCSRLIKIEEELRQELRIYL